jgi:hypothetical protein
MTPTAVVHKGVASINRWPSPGDELPVTVDREKPDRLVIHWNDLPTGSETAQSMAEQLAAQMRGGGAPVAGTTTSSTTVTVNGKTVNLPPGTPSGLGAMIENAVERASQLQAQYGGTAGATPSMPTVSNDDILARGIAGNATLLGTFPPPVPVVEEGRTGVGLMLNVMIDGRPPYQVQSVYAVPQAKVVALKVGSLLPVRADQTTPNLVAIDWNAISV